MEGEITQVLHYLKKDKIPGLDGWPIEFYLGFYDLMGGDLPWVEEQLRVVGHMHAPINAMFLDLIPKIENPTTYDDL